jgi:hypothetical protein
MVEWRIMFRQNFWADCSGKVRDQLNTEIEGI